MKKLLFALLTLVSLAIFAQDKIIVHTAMSTNIHTYFTKLDYPGLTGNPNASIVYKHVWNPNGASLGVYNNNIDGLYYDGQYWYIYNEDHSTPMVNGASFFIYVCSNPNLVITHTATAANQGALLSTTLIDDYRFNNNDPGPYAVFSNYWHGVYNTHNYGFYYDSSAHKRGIVEEQVAVDPIPTNVSFKILIEGSGIGVHRFSHISTASNTSGNVTYIDNTYLNNNPNATFVYEHYSGISGSSPVYSNSVISAYYSVSQNKWALYTEDLSAFPVGMHFDIIVAPQDTAGVNDIVSQTNVSLLTNPVQDVAKIISDENIQKVIIYNLLGQKVREINQNFQNIIVGSLTQGTYVLKVELENGKYKNIKMLKQ